MNFAAHSVRDSKDWLASNSLDFVNRYKHGELEIVLELVWGTGTKRNKHHLIFNAVPLVLQGHLEKSSASDGYSFPDKDIKRSDNTAVLVSVAGFVDCAQNIVPSEVRLEPAKERLD